MRIQHESIIIESSIPIAHILQLEMIDRLNEHGSLKMNIVICPDSQDMFLQSSYLGQNIKFFADIDNESLLIFSGKIWNVTYEHSKDVVVASIDAISYSVELDEEKKRRSFQDEGMMFKILLDLVIKDTNARSNWQAGSDKVLGKPFVQYEETDWEFTKRLASYFNLPVHVSLLSESADFYFGLRPGTSQNIAEATILEEGISDYYYRNGGYVDNASRGEYYYLQARHRQPWQVGDFSWHRSKKLIVIKTQAIFEKGELTFLHTLAAQGYTEQKIIYNEALVGLNLQGVIREVEKESISIQLDIDQDEQAHYFWPWMPEVGNLNYLMPEVDSRVVLTFGTNDEKDAYAAHLLRTNSNSGVYEQIENKQIVTADDKTIGLYPEKLLLAGENHDDSVTLKDQEGIRLESNKRIRMFANKDIRLSGKKVTIDAPNQVLLQTSQANIDVATNFNFFAPSGVSTSSELSYQAPSRSKAANKTDPNHLPLVYGAIGAMPKSIGASAGQSQVASSASGILPKMAGGQTAVAMNEMMNGTSAAKTSHPKVFSSMGSFSMKGGSRVPKEEIADMA